MSCFKKLRSPRATSPLDRLRGGRIVPLIGLCLAFTCAPGLHAADDIAIPSTQGANADEITRLNEAGMELYQRRDYRRAVEKFLQAYAIDRDPNLLFNIARCYEQLGDSEAAIEKYEEFVKMPGADTQGKQRAYESLDQLRKLVAAAESGSPLEPEKAQPEVAPAAEQASTPAEPPEPEGTRREGPGLWPWLALGGGVVVTAVGGTFYMLGQSDHDQVKGAANYGERGRVVDMTEAEARNWVEKGNDKKLYGAIGVGVGGALLVTSAVLFIIGGESEENPPSPQIAFVPSHDGAGVLWTGSF